jgi:hypothetical protein
MQLNKDGDTIDIQFSVYPHYNGALCDSLPDEEINMDRELEALLEQMAQRMEELRADYRKCRCLERYSTLLSQMDSTRG